LFLAVFTCVKAQEIPVNYTLGENNSDRYKFSTVLNIDADNNDQTVIVRTYYGGMPLRPKGHFIELYDADLNLIEDYNNKYPGQYMVDGFIKNGQLYLLELKYLKGSCQSVGSKQIQSQVWQWFFNSGSFQ